MRKYLAFTFVMLLMILPSGAQGPQTADPKELLALVKEVQIQQAQIGENQTKIETKLAEIAENLRVARIFSQRIK